MLSSRLCLLHSRTRILYFDNDHKRAWIRRRRLVRYSRTWEEECIQLARALGKLERYSLELSVWLKAYACTRSSVKDTAKLKIQYRAKNDIWNSISSGFLAGGVLARNSGPKAALGGGLAFAAFSAIVDVAFLRREPAEYVIIHSCILLELSWSWFIQRGLIFIRIIFQLPYVLIYCQAFLSSSHCAIVGSKKFKLALSHEICIRDIAS